MASRLVYFVRKRVIDGEFESSHFVDFLHLLLKVWTMAISPVVALMSTLCEEKPSMDKFVQKCLVELVKRPILEKRLAQPHNAEETSTRTSGGLVEVAEPRTLSHTLGPFKEYFAFEIASEKCLIVCHKEIVYIGIYYFRVHFKLVLSNLLVSFDCGNTSLELSWVAFEFLFCESFLHI